MRRKMEAATYGAFLGDVFTSDAAAFRISRTEARGLDPAATLVLETSYDVLHDPFGSSNRARLTNAPVGVFLGAGGSVAS
jgi:acyl transferase domain-containing protein